MMTDEEHDIGRVFAALTNDDRRAILQSLRNAHSDGQPGMSIAEIATSVEISRFNASHHLAVLRGAGLVHTVADKRRQISSLVPNVLEEAVGWLISLVEEAHRTLN
jgi:DNA-binding transcriptional ArsR family regulator